MRLLGRYLSPALLLALTLAVTGCSGFFVYPGSTGGGGSTSTGNYVYVANALTGSIAGFSIGSSTLTAVNGSPYILGFAPTALAVNPANSILFVGNSSSIYAFAINSDGSLSVLNNGSAVGLAAVASMDISPDGQWLFALDQNGFTIDEFQINSSTGLLTAQTGAQYPGSTTAIPRAIRVAPNGSYVFAALGTGGDLVFPFNTSTGALFSPLTLAVASGSSDNALAVGPNSSHLYIARSGTAGGLAVYTIGSGGALTAVSGSPFAAGDQPFSVAVNKAGTYVYLANQLDSNISAYSIGSSGSLTALSGSPYTNVSQPTVLLPDSTGTYMLVASQTGSPDLSMYTFDSAVAGKLDLATSTASGTDPAGSIAMATTH